MTPYSDKDIEDLFNEINLLNKQNKELTERLNNAENEIHRLWCNKEPANTDWHPSD